MTAAIVTLLGLVGVALIARAAWQSRGRTVPKHEGRDKVLARVEADAKARRKAREPEVVVEARRLLAAYDGTQVLASSWSKQALELSDGLFGAWHPDPFVRGMMHGEGYAWMRMHQILNHLVNGMSMSSHAAKRGGEDDA